MARSVAAPSIPIRAISAIPARLEHTGAREAARLLSSVALVLFAAYAAAYVGRVNGLLLYPFDLDQGEGYDVNSGWLLLNGLGIYTSNEQWPYYSSNYPPVFSLLLTPLLALMGPTLAAGRLLSAIAAMLTAVLIAVAVRRERGTPLAAVIAGLLYLASPYVFHTTPLARVNALTELFSLAGLVLCFGRGRTSFWIGLLLLIVGAYTKPTVLPLIGLVVVYGALTRPSITLPASAVLGVCSILPLVWIERSTNGAFWLNVVSGNLNPWGWGQAIAYWTNFSVIHAGLLIIVVMALPWRAGARYWLYVLATMPTVIGVGKWGAGESYFLGLIVALCVLVGCGLSVLSFHAVRLGIASSALILQAALFIHEPFSHALGLRHDLGIQAESLGTTPRESDALPGWELVEILDTVPGPILAEDAAFAFVSGREVVGNATHLRNLYASGHWLGTQLLADIEAREFAWIVLDAQLYPEPVLQTIGRTYYLYHVVVHRGAEQWIFAPGADPGQ